MHILFYDSSGLYTEKITVASLNDNVLVFSATCEKTGKVHNFVADAISSITDSTYISDEEIVEAFNQMHAEMKDTDDWDGGNIHRCPDCGMHDGIYGCYCNQIKAK